MSKSSCIFPLLLLVLGGILGASEGDLERNAALAADAHQRSLTRAEQSFYERRVAAHKEYLEQLRQAKRKHIEAGSVTEAGQLECREQEIEALLASDVLQLKRRRHELMPPAEFTVEGSGFDLKVLRNGATAYGNRDYKWQNVPEKLEGWQYAQIDGGDTPNFRLVITTDGVVYALAEGSELEDHGWTPHTNLQFHWYAGRSPMIVFTREAAAGTVVEIPHHGWTGTMVLLPARSERAQGDET